MGQALLLVLVASLPQLEQHASEAGNHAEETHCSLVDLCSNDDFGHVCPRHCRHEVSNEVDELNCNELPLLVDLVQALQKLHGRHFLQLLL